MVAQQAANSHSDRSRRLYDYDNDADGDREANFRSYMNRRREEKRLSSSSTHSSRASSLMNEDELRAPPAARRGKSLFASRNGRGKFRNGGRRFIRFDK